jgi:hypothetical protein
MKTAIATLKSISPYSQSRFHNTPKLDKEGHDAYDKRTWRERLNTAPDGRVCIPPMAFKNCLSEAAKFLSIPIKGKGKSTYTKHFEAGVMVTDPLLLDIHKDKVASQELHVPSDGRRGGTTRVLKTFPVIAEWSGRVEYHVLDDTITKDVFAQHLEQAGKFIGIGRFRPKNNGFYGRFKVEKIDWVEG